MVYATEPEMDPCFHLLEIMEIELQVSVAVGVATIYGFARFATRLHVSEKTDVKSMDERNVNWSLVCHATTEK